jgi:hypothetical protein
MQFRKHVLTDVHNEEADIKWPAEKYYLQKLRKSIARRDIIHTESFTEYTPHQRH